MDPREVARDFGHTLLGNAAAIVRGQLRRTFAGALADHLQKAYPDPVAFDEAIANGEDVLAGGWRSIPADGLAAARIIPGAMAAAAAAGKEDWRAVLGFLKLPPEQNGFGLPEHEAVLERRWHWYCAQMEQAKAMFLGRQP